MPARPSHLARPSSAAARQDRIPAGIVADRDVARLLGTPAEVGGKSIWLTDQCVRRHRARRRSSQPRWHTRLVLRQLLETGRYRRSRPAWLPTDIDVFDAYLELVDGDELVGLIQDPEEPRTFRAVTWFDRGCLGWDALAEESAPRDGAIRVELSAHCVERYHERVVRHGTVMSARDELTAVFQCGRLLPEVPTWCREHARGGVPAYWLIVDDWLVLPLEPSGHPKGDVFRAVTCMYRDMHADERIHPRFAPLLAEKLRLHRHSLLQLTAGASLPEAA